MKENKTARIYVASSIYDKPLKQKNYSLMRDETVLQVGAALTDKKIYGGVLTDDTGENISKKNQQYCELTGLYWIWKNAKEDYVGMVHYRRHFLLPEDWLERMMKNDVDVILPVPLYVEPCLSENYRERHIAADWDYLMEYIQKNLSSEYDTAVEFFGGGLYSPCNMLIAKKPVFDELCSWLFPILDAAALHIGKREDKYQNRYPGFMAERLMTYFFEGRGRQYNIVYANKSFWS